MKIRYPKYYDNFTCIAARCPDSCCKEWSVDVDAASAAFYRNLSGPLGDQLRQVLQDTDSGTIMTIENNRCPMWQQDGLCRIQAELGHDALCQVCQIFPRLRHDYGDFVELDLELSCPEAARLILTSADQDWITYEQPKTEPAGYDTWAMDILLRSRSEFFKFLDATDLSVPQILTVLLLYAHHVQEELDGGISAVLSPNTFLSDAARFTHSVKVQALPDFFLNLEILTPHWEGRLKSPRHSPQWNSQYKTLLKYFLRRYWLQAVSDYDILCRAKFSISACLLIGYLGGDLIETAQLFSKEIENDPENMDAILDGAYTASALTDIYLFSLLAQS